VPSDPLRHGEHSLAHRGVVAATPPPVLPTVAPTRLRLVPRSITIVAEPRSRRPLTQSARGPPA
jgi:hypothetical protein